MTFVGSTMAACGSISGKLMKATIPKGLTENVRLILTTLRGRLRQILIDLALDVHSFSYNDIIELPSQLTEEDLVMLVSAMKDINAEQIQQYRIILLSGSDSSDLSVGLEKEARVVGIRCVIRQFDIMKAMKKLDSDWLEDVMIEYTLRSAFLKISKAT